VLRFWLTPRRLALHLLAIALVAVMGWLGAWQLDRALDTADGGNRPDPAPVPFTRFSIEGQALPGQAYGRRVTLTGTYDADGQALVAGRPRGDRAGLWLLTPLRLDDGSAVPVVRGWVPDGDAPAVDAVPRGEVTVTGRAYPSEQQAGARSGSLPPGRVDRASAAVLAPTVPYAVRDGFVVATDQRPAPEVAPAPVAAEPWSTKADGFPLQNSAYALQWWLFALFVVFMWGRIMRDALRRERAPSPQVTPDDHPGRVGAS
jgi:cytochrome oxidase assembly protein ShyY1